MAQFADDLDELLTALAVSDPVTVCGLSMGGYIALEMWQRHAPRIARLVLCDTRAESDSTEVARGRELMAQQVERDGMIGVADSMLPKLVSDTTIATSDDTIASIKKRVAAYPWHERPEDCGWGYGTHLEYMQELCDYWTTEFDWRKQEEKINQFAHFKAPVDGINIHFIHINK